VYFAKNVGLQLKVCDGQNLTATELFEDVMEEQNYPPEARQLFSLWLVSDLLGEIFTDNSAMQHQTIVNCYSYVS